MRDIETFWKELMLSGYRPQDITYTELVPTGFMLDIHRGKISHMYLYMLNQEHQKWIVSVVPSWNVAIVYDGPEYEFEQFEDAAECFMEIVRSGKTPKAESTRAPASG